MKMAEDFNHIDQIIRQKFESFEPEPPMKVWENIKSGINKTPPPPSSHGIILPLVVIISILIFISGLVHNIYYSSSDPKAEASGMSVQSASVISTGSTTISDPTLQQEFIQTPPEVPAENIAVVTPVQAQQTVIPVRVPFEQSPAGNKRKHSAGNNPLLSANASPPASYTASKPRQLNPGLVQALKAGELSYADAVRYDLSPRDVKKLSGYREYSKKSPADWSVGIYFNPEVTSCKDGNIANTKSYNVSILPRVSFNRFFIQSGLNVRYTSDKGNYAVYYNRFLGTYEDVYLVTFDSTENGVIPTYYTHTVEVYDTLHHYAVSEPKTGYTYLEIPLFLGYSYSFGKFSILAKAGPSASFLVNRHLPDAGSPEEKARIINADYQVPVRSYVNWQMMMGAGFEYKLADKISFSLEPTFRFALKPEYDLTGGLKGNTTSFGVRAGLNYHF
jgi:hypothetical protein